MKNVNDFVMTAGTLENTGVSAYDGAINTLSYALSLSLMITTNCFYRSADLREAAATIATVEARHAAYLNGVNGMIPFPDTRDKPLTPTQVIAGIQPFLLGCSYEIRVPFVVEFEHDMPGNGGSSSIGQVSLFALMVALLFVA